MIAIDTIDIGSCYAEFNEMFVISSKSIIIAKFHEAVSEKFVPMQALREARVPPGQRLKLLSSASKHTGNRRSVARYVRSKRRTSNYAIA
jgi:hypothetical protein